ncbi:UDP-N-acetylenolpyruvoylglucosamine reductase [Quillaja saponaria]|uniref:UDP-N-acetylenolpyruvoylglucosamine reductase n=1 Tax=Quillaja saponaria TaxID=32244 RepID=A0AAD7LD92_QUISA|nr:UDP-N-acetylenolpyruvoylglucosamine reductase [Quillaja saponaria]
MVKNGQGAHTVMQKQTAIRAILHKKINPQRSNPTMTQKKYLETRHMTKSSNYDVDESDSNAEDGKWVNTDSDCQLLYIDVY